MQQLRADRDRDRDDLQGHRAVSASTSYSYRVRASDAAGNLSPYSNTASAPPRHPDTTPPSQPGTLTATAVSGGEIDLSWGASTDNVGVTGYRVERCQGAGCTQLRPDRDAATAHDLQGHERQRVDTSYSYRVRASDAAGNLSPYSNTASATHPDARHDAAVAAGDADRDRGLGRRGRSVVGRVD